MLLFSLEVLLLIGHLLFKNGVSANTEIINFAATSAEYSNLPFTDSWCVSNFSQAESIIINSSKLVKRHILDPENPTLRWDIISAAPQKEEEALSHFESTICQDLEEWDPVRNVVVDDGVCPHEFWLILDLDREGWREYEKFTLRLSWPAYVRSLSFLIFGFWG